MSDSGRHIGSHRRGLPDGLWDHQAHQFCSRGNIYDGGVFCFNLPFCRSYSLSRSLPSICRLLWAIRGLNRHGGVSSAERCAEAFGSDHGDRCLSLSPEAGESDIGSMDQAFPIRICPRFLQGASAVGGVTIINLQIFIFATAFILMLGLHLIIKKTKIGRAMRAWAQDQIAAKLMGVDVNRVVSFTFAIGSSLAGVAGILVAMY